MDSLKRTPPMGKEGILENKQANTNKMRAIKAKQTRLINRLDKIYQETFPDREFTKNTKRTIRLQFIPKLQEDDLELAITLACSRKPYSPHNAIKYFFWVCWKKIKELE